MRIVSLESAGYASNSYLILQDAAKEFAVVDPSVDTMPAQPYLCDGWKLKYVLLTHGHFDHILFVDAWRALGAKVCIFSATRQRACTCNFLRGIHGMRPPTSFCMTGTSSRSAARPLR